MQQGPFLLLQIIVRFKRYKIGLETLMILSHAMMTFDTVRKNPGLDLDGLADKIYESYGDTLATRFLTGSDARYVFLPQVISFLDCVVNRDGAYYYNPETKPYSQDNIINVCIENQLKEEAKALKASLSHKCE